LRILQVCSAQTLGGGERHVLDLANALSARGHEVHAVLRPNSPLVPQLKLPDKNILTLPLRNALDASSARQLSSYVRQHRIEIIHAHMGRDYPVAAFARNRSSNLIVTRHVLFPLNRLHSVTLGRAARVIAVSHAVKDRLTTQRLVNPERIVVIHNGIDTSKFLNADNQSRSKLCDTLNVPEDGMLIGSVGEITPLKGHADFVGAAALVAKQFSNCNFVIAGMDSSTTGEHLKSLQQEIANRGVKQIVSVRGWIEDLPSFYAALDIFVSASHSESFGLAIAEAMASGKPVIATETDGAREIIEHEASGLLVPVGDVHAISRTITDLINNKELRANLGQSGRARVQQRFSLEQMVDRTEELYRQASTD
jgi:glycosyltransferase involved in cell wall biosynthesis